MTTRVAAIEVSHWHALNDAAYLRHLVAMPDVELVASAVRLHLLLPMVATRRDLDDPVTVKQVATAVGSRALLELRQAIMDGEDPMPKGQYHLALCQLVAGITAQLGRPQIRPSGAPDIAAATRLVCAEQAWNGQPPASSQPSPAPR